MPAMSKADGDGANQIAGGRVSGVNEQMQSRVMLVPRDQFIGLRRLTLDANVLIMFSRQKI